MVRGVSTSEANLGSLAGHPERPVEVLGLELDVAGRDPRQPATRCSMPSGVTCRSAGTPAARRDDPEAMRRRVVRPCCPSCSVS